MFKTLILILLLSAIPAGLRGAEPAAEEGDGAASGEEAGASDEAEPDEGDEFLPIEGGHEVEVETVVTEVEIEVEELLTEDEREDGDRGADSGHPFMAIGGGGGAVGPFANRTGGRKRRALGRFGGSRASESAVDSALRWFKHHQSPNGAWDVDGYPVNCTLAGPKCEPGDDARGWGDVELTGLVCLSYLASGYDPRTANKHRKVVAAALAKLCLRQGENGSWGSPLADALATAALVEAYGMTRNARFRDPAQRGVDHLLASCDPADDPDRLPGWRGADDERGTSRTRITAWHLVALEGARAAGLETGDAADAANAWFEAAWRAANPDWRSFDGEGDVAAFPETVSAVGEAPEVAGNVPGFGAASAFRVGREATDTAPRTLVAALLADHLEEVGTFPYDLHHGLFATEACFRRGGEAWTAWNDRFRDALVNEQRLGPPCFDGSWDPLEGFAEADAAATGRLLSTALATLSLQVYYRYAPTAGDD